MRTDTEILGAPSGLHALESTVAIIGAGNMGSSLVRGILQAGLADHDRIVVSGTHAEKLQGLHASWHVRHTLNNKEAVDGADIVILCVKPHVVAKVLEEAREVIRENQLIISIAAGITIDSIRSRVGKNIPVVRAMPNIASTVGEGATGIAYGLYVTEEQRRCAESIFRAVGEVVVVEESHLDAVTGLSGSGPAYIYMVIEALIDGGVKAGLPRATATTLAVQTVLGSARLVKETGLHPAILRDQVTTPGGTAINAIHELETHGLRSMLIQAVGTAAKRSKELSE